MSDTDTDSLSHPSHSDLKPERLSLGKSTINTTLRNRGSNVSPDSVDFVQIEPSTRLGFSFSTRSSHQPSNRVGSVPLEEAGSCKGEKLLASPTLTHPQRDTPPILSCHRGWAMGREGTAEGGREFRYSIHNNNKIFQINKFSPWDFHKQKNLFM